MLKIIAISLLAFSAGSAASAPAGKFSGEVHIGSADAHAFDMLVPIGGSDTVLIDGGYTLELTVPSFNKSIARLKDSSGKVLHESTSTGPVQERPTFIYQVCDSGVLFVSPARADLAKCSD